MIKTIYKINPYIKNIMLKYKNMDLENYFIKGFFQNKNKNKNIFYIYNDLNSYEINLKNGKMKTLNLIDFKGFGGDIVIDKYVIKSTGADNFLVISDENNKQVFIKQIYPISRYIIINEKEKMFASLHFLPSFFEGLLNVKVFKIYNKQ